MEYALKNLKTNRIMPGRYNSENQAILAKKLRENGNKFKVVKRETSKDEWRGIKQWLMKTILKLIDIMYML